MLKKIVGTVHKQIARIMRASARERPMVALLYVPREAFNLLHDRVTAKLAGWPKSSLGYDSKVLGSRVITVGAHASVKRHAWIEAIFEYNDQIFNPSITIGQKFFASDRLHISAINRIEIGDNCLFGSGVYISDHNHGMYKGDEQSKPSEPPIERKLVSWGSVIIGSNVWFGDNVIVVGPVKIGNGAVIGANSVVTRDVPDRVMAAGAPLRMVKSFNEDIGVWEECR